MLHWGRPAAAAEALSRQPRRTLLRWVGWFWFFIATLSLLAGLRYGAVAGVPDGAAATLFFAALTLGHWYSLYFLLALLLFVPLVMLLPSPRLVISLALGVALLSLMAVVVDVFVFGLFRFHLNGLVFSLLFSDAAGEIFVFSLGNYLISAVLLLLVVAAVMAAARLAWQMALRRTRPRLGLALGAALCAAFLLENLWFSWADAAGATAITAQAGIYPLYQPTRAAALYYRYGLVDPDAAAARVQTATAGRVQYPRQPLACTAPAALPNIFLIVVDSWRRDAFTAEITPRIHEFARQAVVFPRHLSGGNNTRTGLFSLFYGVPATYWEAFLDARQGAPLISALQQHDYDLAIYASAKLTAPEFDKTIFAAVANLRTATEARSVYGRDVRATEEFVAHLQQRNQRPLFGFLFYDAPHAYVAAERYKNHFQPAAAALNYYSLTNDSDPEPILNLYRNSVISNDLLVGQALDAIKAAGLWDNSIIIITGDHAQEFNDNKLNFWGHNGNFTDAQLGVPLLVKWPGQDARTADYATTHFDISATLMQQALGCSNPIADYSLGTPLFAAAERFGFVVGGFGDFGVRLADRIYQVDKFGGIQVLSEKNRPLDERPDPQVLSKAMRQISEYIR